MQYILTDVFYRLLGFCCPRSILSVVIFLLESDALFEF